MLLMSLSYHRLEFLRRQLTHLIPDLFNLPKGRILARSVVSVLLLRNQFGQFLQLLLNRLTDRRLLTVLIGRGHVTSLPRCS